MSLWPVKMYASVREGAIPQRPHVSRMRGKQRPLSAVCVLAAPSSHPAEHALLLKFLPIYIRIFRPLRAGQPRETAGRRSYQRTFFAHAPARADYSSPTRTLIHAAAAYIVLPAALEGRAPSEKLAATTSLYSSLSSEVSKSELAEAARDHRRHHVCLFPNRHVSFSAPFPAPSYSARRFKAFQL